MYLRKIFKIIFFHLVIVLSLANNNPAQQKINSLLWEISGNGLNKPSYLYGTIHIKDKRVFNISDTAAIKLNEIPVIALEIDFDDAVQEVLQIYLKEMKKSKDSTTFKEEHESIFSEKEKDIIRKKLAQITGSPEESIQTDNPWLIFFTIYQYKNLQGEMSEVLDQRIYRVAQDNNKRIIGLETVRDQLNIFFNLDQKLVRRMILDELENNSSDQKNELINAYIAQDLQKLNSILRSKQSEFPEFYDLLIDKRNENMAKKIQGLIDTVQTFIAVGAGHLPGEKGLITLLKKNGYQLRPVTSSYKESLADSFIAYKNEKTYKISSPEGAFEATFPTRPLTNTHSISLPETGDSLKLYQWISTGNQNQNFSVIQYVDIGGERKIDNDSAVLAGALTNIISTNSGKIEYVKERRFSTYPGIEAKIRIQNDILKLWQIVRGSRNYSIMTNIVNEDSSNAENFLNAFKFLPYSSPEWNRYTDDSLSFSIEFPGTVKFTSGSTDNITIRNYAYSASDKYSGQNYGVFQQLLSDYYQVESDSTLFQNILNGMQVDSNLIVSQKTFYFEGLPAKEYIIKSTTTHNLNKIRIIINGNKIYKLIINAPEECINNESANHFYYSLRIIEPKKDISILFRDKSQKLLNDLCSPDTVLSNSAKNYLEDFDFSAQHLEQIYSALKKNYWDDIFSHSTRIKLFNQLWNIKDSSTVDFISEIYPELPNNPEMLTSAIRVLSRINSNKAITKVKELLLKRAPTGETVGSMFYPLYNKKRNINILFPELLTFLNNNDYKESIYSLVSRVIDSSTVVRSELQKFKNIIINDLHTYKSQRDSILSNTEDSELSETVYTDYDPILNSLIKCVFIFADDKDVEKILTSVAEDTSSAYMSLTSIVSLLKMNGKIMEKRISLLAEDKISRNDLYDELLKINKGQLFPAQYKTHEALAEGDLYYYLNNDDLKPDQIVLIEKKELVRSGKKGIYYLYKFYYKDEDQWYAGISGPQPIEGEAVPFADETSTNYDLLQSDNLEKHWKELLPEDVNE